MRNSWNPGVVIALLLLSLGAVAISFINYEPPAPTIMQLFIEHEESGVLYQINRRIYRTKNVCKAAAVALREGSQTIWLEGYPDAYILKRIRCHQPNELGSVGPEERHRLNEKYAQQFIGG